MKEAEGRRTLGGYSQSFERWQSDESAGFNTSDQVQRLAVTEFLRRSPALALASQSLLWSFRRLSSRHLNPHKEPLGIVPSVNREQAILQKTLDTRAVIPAPYSTISIPPQQRI
ncbi:hypothetical protein EYF80_018368 [Liparis tanakae]|uniref:Uncharacterized protein n=1 Tax=Liparis tanakae TaxID=230148 RepID=A0A4Z2HZZ6_9TELE|nr:hypothetical protein EYF80_018368 [Liparis tanakae]